MMLDYIVMLAPRYIMNTKYFRCMNNQHTRDYYNFLECVSLVDIYDDYDYVKIYKALPSSTKRSYIFISPNHESDRITPSISVVSEILSTKYIH